MGGSDQTTQIGGHYTEWGGAGAVPLEALVIPNDLCANQKSDSHMSHLRCSAKRGKHVTTALKRKKGAISHQHLRDSRQRTDTGQIRARIRQTCRYQAEDRSRQSHRNQKPNQRPAKFQSTDHSHSPPKQHQHTPVTGRNLHTSNTNDKTQHAPPRIH